MRIHLNIFVIGLTLLIAGCGSGTSGQVAQRLASPTPTLQSGHIVRVPVDRSKKTTPLPTLAPGVPTPVLPTGWSAAVLDANLNGRSVMPVAEALAKRKVPFVFATGYGETGGAPGGFDAPVIRKPDDFTQVAAAVAGLLGAPA